MSQEIPSPPEWLPDWAESEFERLAAAIIKANRGDPSSLVLPWESMAGHLACLQAKFASLDDDGRRQVAKIRQDFNLSPFFEVES